jgi:hypothetical protein
MADRFRNTTWSDAIEEEFSRRLSRARSQRDQYPAIQALMLARERPDVTFRLVELYFDTRSDDFDDIRAWTAKAEASIRVKDFSSAALAYKLILTRERARPGYKTTAYIDYPFMVAAERLESEYQYALSVLEERKSDVAFPLGRFKGNAAYALILNAMGESNAARPYASAAIAAARERSSEFCHHRKLGLVDPSYAQIAEQLEELTA